MEHYAAIIAHYWVVAVVIAFGLVALVLAIRDYRRDKTMYVAPEAPQAEIEKPVEPQRIVPRFDATSMDEIHSHYAELADADPKLAGRLKYEAELKLHGR